MLNDYIKCEMPISGIKVLINNKSKYNIGTGLDIEGILMSLEVSTRKPINSDEEFISRVSTSKKYLVYPLYKYEHDTVIFSITPFNCKFDSCLIGFIGLDKNELRKFFKTKLLNNDIKNNIELLLIDALNAYTNDFN